MDKAPGEIRGTSPLRYYLRILQSQADAPLNHRGTSGFSSEVKARRGARQAEKLVLMSDGYPDRDLRVVAGSILFIARIKSPLLQRKFPRPQVGNFQLSPHKRILHSVALSVEDQQVAVVHQSIDQSRGHGLIEENVHPPAELQVGGDCSSSKDLDTCNNFLSDTFSFTILA